MTIMGVKFSDLKTLENTANGLGSNMFEGFEPTPRGVEICNWQNIITLIGIIWQIKNLCLNPINILILLTSKPIQKLNF